MLIGPEMNAAINEEIGRELQASHEYIQIASYFDDLALRQLAKLFVKQSDEERSHALKFVDYVNDTGGKVEVPAVAAPRSQFASVEDALQHALDWELEVTRHINDLMALAIDRKDYAAQDFLRWFVSEQVEEVRKMEDMLKIVRHAGDRFVVMLEAYLAHE